jgi:hypothetical protein
MTSFKIQTVEFEFKRGMWTNQNVTPSYLPLALVAGSTMVGIGQAVLTRLAPTEAVPPTLGDL